MSEKFDFKKFNKDLVKGPERFGYNDLTNDILSSYLNQAKYLDENGVVKYHIDFTNEESRLKNISTDISNKIQYHLNQRHYGMDDSQITELNSIRDPNGRSISESIREMYFPGTSATNLEKILKDEPSKIDTQMILGLANSSLQNYDQIITSQLLNDKIGNDVEKAKTGIRTLNESYDLLKKEKLEKQIKDGQLKDLLGMYGKLLEGARNKD